MSIKNRLISPILLFEKIRNYCVVVFLVTVAIIYSGCASMLVLRESGTHGKKEISTFVSCTTAKRSVLWTQISMGKPVYKGSSSKLTKIEQEQFSMISSYLDKISENSCNKPTRVIVDIINSPVNESKVLRLLNFLSLGIVPYWDDYQNTLKISLYENSELVKSYSSQLNYTRYQSIFLLVVSHSVVTSEDELNIETIPIHFSNLKEDNEGGHGLN